MCTVLLPPGVNPIAVRKVALPSGYSTLICLSVPKLPLQCAVVSLYSIDKQRLKCNTGKMRNCLIQVLLTTGVSFEELVFRSAQRLSERTVYHVL
jgi:hypothetical protein